MKRLVSPPVYDVATTNNSSYRVRCAWGGSISFILKSLFAVVMVSLCAPALADQFYLFAHLDCDTSKSELTVTFSRAWNEEGEAIIANLGPRDINPRSLINFSQGTSGKYQITKKVDQRVCRIGGQNYTVEFSSFTAPHFHPEGFCATRIGAKAIVKLHGKVVAVAGIDACTEEGSVIKSMRLTPGKRLIYEKIAAREFYGT